MKFEAIYGRWQQRELSQAEAAEILGMSERTFRRWRDRYQDEGAAGLLDRRLGKASARRVAVDQVEPMLTCIESAHFNQPAQIGLMRSEQRPAVTAKARRRGVAGPPHAASASLPPPG
jgi:transposase